MDLGIQAKKKKKESRGHPVMDAESITQGNNNKSRYTVYKSRYTVRFSDAAQRTHIDRAHS